MGTAWVKGLQRSSVMDDGDFFGRPCTPKIGEG